MSEAESKCGICLDEIKNPEWSLVTNLCPLCKREFTSLEKKSQSGKVMCTVAIEKKKQRISDQGLDGWAGSSGSGEDDSENDSFIVDDDHISYSASEEDILERHERRLENRELSFTTFDEEESGSIRVESDSEEEPILSSSESGDFEPDSGDNTFIVGNDHVSYSSESDELERAERRLDNHNNKRTFQQLTQREDDVAVLRRVRKRSDEPRAVIHLRSPQRVSTRQQTRRKPILTLTPDSSFSHEDKATRLQRQKLLASLDTTDGDESWFDTPRETEKKTGNRETQTRREKKSRRRSYSEKNESKKRRRTSDPSWGDSVEERTPEKKGKKREGKKKAEKPKETKMLRDEGEGEGPSTQEKRERLQRFMFTESDEECFDIPKRTMKNEDREEDEIEDEEVEVKEKSHVVEIGSSSEDIVVNASRKVSSPKKSKPPTKARMAVEALLKKRQENRKVLTLSRSESASGSGEISIIPRSSFNSNNSEQGQKNKGFVRRKELEIDLSGSGGVEREQPKPLPTFPAPAFHRTTSETYWNSTPRLSSLSASQTTTTATTTSTTTNATTNTTTNTTNTTTNTRECAPSTLPIKRQTIFPRSNSSLSSNAIASTNTSTNTTAATSTNTNTTNKPFSVPRRTDGTSITPAAPKFTRRALNTNNTTTNTTTTTTTRKPFTTNTNTAANTTPTTTTPKPFTTTNATTNTKLATTTPTPKMFTTNKPFLTRSTSTLNAPHNTTTETSTNTNNTKTPTTEVKPKPMVIVPLSQRLAKSQSTNNITSRAENNKDTLATNIKRTTTFGSGITTPRPLSSSANTQASPSIGGKYKFPTTLNRSNPLNNLSDENSSNSSNSPSGSFSLNSSGNSIASENKQGESDCQKIDYSKMARFSSQRPLTKPTLKIPQSANNKSK